MEFSVSSLSYPAARFGRMARLDREWGIEIFWEWGNEDWYKHMVPRLMEGRTGKFSIHGPMTVANFTDDLPEEKIFEEMKKPFDLYHRCGGSFYVLHTHGGSCVAPDATEAELAEKRAIATERIARFHEICRAEGVELMIENIGKTAAGKTVFDETAFLELFRQLPELKCLLDVGHAVLGDYDIGRVQKTLGHQLAAYHIHDNRGTTDDHLRIREGIIDWNAWKTHFHQYTPGAEVVLEYNDLADEAGYRQDVDWLRSAD